MMMSRLILFITLLGFCTLGCSAVEMPARPLSPSELNGNPARYNDQNVIVKGFVKLAPEGHVLYESRELDAEFARKVDAGGRFDAKSYRKYCLTIANPDLFYKNQKNLNGRTVVVQGKFIDDYLDGKSIDFGACPLPTAIIIDEENFRKRYGRLLTAE